LNNYYITNPLGEGMLRDGGREDMRWRDGVMDTVLYSDFTASSGRGPMEVLVGELSNPDA
jgi:hypothetical protein